MNCHICRSQEWLNLDEIKVQCPACQKTGLNKKCPQCQGAGQIVLKLRNRDFWFRQSYLYDEPVGFQICKHCGFVTYDRKWKKSTWITKINKIALSDKLIIAYMRRARALANFLPATTGKVHEINCGLGCLNKLINVKQYTGWNYTPALNEFSKTNGVQTLESIPRDADIVVIQYYLQMEHDPRMLLDDIHKTTNASAKLCLEVPLQLRDLQDVSGHGTLAFELAYHPNLINVFSARSFKNLLAVTGWKIVKEEKSINGLRALCEKTEPTTNILRENYQDIVNILIKQSQAIKLLEQGLSMAQEISRREEAHKLIEKSLNVYPQYLDAWIGLSTQNVNYSDPVKLKEIFEKADKEIQYKERLYLHFAKLFKNWGEKETSWTKLAMELCNKVLAVNPGCADAYMILLYINAVVLRDEQKANELYKILLDIAPESWGMITNTAALCYQHKYGG